MRTLGEGTLSAFVLHWWTRPIWLRCIVLLLRYAAPNLQHCDAEETAGSRFAEAVVFCLHTGLLILVQFSLSSWRIDLGSAGDQNGSFSEKASSIFKKRAWPLVQSILRAAFAVGGWIWLYRQMSSPHDMYAGDRCAAVVPLRMTSTELGGSYRPSRDKRIQRAAPVSSSMCLFVGNETSMGRGGFCSNLAARLRKIPPNTAIAPMISKELSAQLIPCLNHDHVCDYGFGYYMPTAPWLTALHSTPSSELRPVAKSISESCSPLHATRECSLLQLSRFMQHYKQECSSIIALHPSFLLGPKHVPALHRQPEIRRFLESQKLVLTMGGESGLEAFSWPLIDNIQDQSDTSDENSMIFVLKNSMLGVSLVRDWATFSPIAMQHKYRRHLMIAPRNESTFGRYIRSTEPSSNIERAFSYARKKWARGISACTGSLSYHNSTYGLKRPAATPRKVQKNGEIQRSALIAGL